MIKNFFGVDLAQRAVTVGEGSALELGRHRIVFYTAPMVHWPEVIVAYDECDKILFSADAFGKFGDLNAEEDWACEARRYYFGIVGKYGQQAQALLKKAAGLDIKYICALHGPVLSENLEYYIGLYNTWSSYTPEEEGVLIAYASVYGNTRAAAELLYSALTERGVRAVITDLARCDMAEAVEDAFRYSKLVLASVTYNADVFPPMKEFLHALTERNYQNRTIGFIENGSWAPAAARVMASFFESSKNISYLDTTPKLLSALSDKSREEIMAMADEIAEK
jgi:flavorubredoxin